jgi:hypothetical protein
VLTAYSNSHNVVKPRDFKSYNQIQVRLQNEIIQNFGYEYFYEIKRGETTSDNLTIIPNEAMSVYLMSFDLEEP